jgi:hypothetical protein
MAAIALNTESSAASDFFKEIVSDLLTKSMAEVPVFRDPVKPLAKLTKLTKLTELTERSGNYLREQQSVLPIFFSNSVAVIPEFDKKYLKKITDFQKSIGLSNKDVYQDDESGGITDRFKKSIGEESNIILHLPRTNFTYYKNENQNEKPTENKGKLLFYDTNNTKYEQKKCIESKETNYITIVINMPEINRTEMNGPLNELVRGYFMYPAKGLPIKSGPIKKTLEYAISNFMVLKNKTNIDPKHTFEIDLFDCFPNLAHIHLTLSSPPVSGQWVAYNSSPEIQKPSEEYDFFTQLQEKGLIITAG